MHISNMPPALRGGGQPRPVFASPMTVYALVVIGEPLSQYGPRARARHGARWQKPFARPGHPGWHPRRAPAYPQRTHRGQQS
ncbi:hypothetical protein DAEQUDRAFT_78696 [Daedalea quercina L-15889]|uniref:Uncharacterized protein n=1 Tax=Daedalea quercina L-15889 TaxID=1314783 RepID=A0A165SG96_9APHY|nr:hypothetical protein DAEQUDRAFT_78696 [Daedalea quercina L-15889]